MAEQALNDSRRYKTELGSKMGIANKNIRERIRAEGMEIDYSPEEDYLHVTIGEPRPSESVSLGDGTRAVILLDPETNVVTGIDAPFFMEDFNRMPVKHEFWRLMASLIKRGGSYIYIPPEEESARAERALGDLVLA